MIRGGIGFRPLRLRLRMSGVREAPPPWLASAESLLTLLEGLSPTRRLRSAFPSTDSLTLQGLQSHELQEGLVLPSSASVRQARAHECTPVACRGAMEKRPPGGNGGRFSGGFLASTVLETAWSNWARPIRSHPQSGQETSTRFRPLSIKLIGGLLPALGATSKVKPWWPSR